MKIEATSIQQFINHKMRFLPVLYVDGKLTSIAGVRPMVSELAATLVAKGHAKKLRRANARRLKAQPLPTLIAEPAEPTAQHVTGSFDVLPPGLVDAIRRQLPEATREVIHRAVTQALPAGARDVVAERYRQVEKEGWTAKHDAEHTDDSLALVAACYAIPQRCRTYHAPENGNPPVPVLWPKSWAPDWWKPKNRRRDLVRAAALLLAEIDRIDAGSPA